MTIKKYFSLINNFDKYYIFCQAIHLATIKNCRYDTTTKYIAICFCGRLEFDLKTCQQCDQNITQIIPIETFEKWQKVLVCESDDNESEVGVLLCGHYYQFDILIDWIQHNNYCPGCDVKLQSFNCSI